MRLNHTLGEMDHNDFDRYGEWRYHVTVMGQPSATEPWGWQLDGHHAIINYFVLGDQVVMTPFFAGSEPVIAPIGQVQGHERPAGRAEPRPGDDSRADRRPSVPKRILTSSKTGNKNLTEAWKDNVVLDYAGLRVADMTDAQRKQLVDLIALYVDNMDDGHARVKMDDVRRHLDSTWFAWIGKTGRRRVSTIAFTAPWS